MRTYLGSAIIYKSHPPRSSFSIKWRMISTITRLNGNRLETVPFTVLSEQFDKFSKTHVDIGTGDAKFIYRLAKDNPSYFYIGIDSNPDGMGHISWKIKRKPSKGGLTVPNLELLHMSVEDLPSEFSQVAHCVTINYPWGSLLKGVTDPDPKILESISKILHVGGELFLNLNYTLYSDKRLISTLEITDLEGKEAVEKLKNIFSFYQLRFREKGLDNRNFAGTTWGKHLTLGSGRETLSLKFSRESNFSEKI
ncbi:MAG: hypothetical protein JSS30_00915 [Verrucomicrobia bacterium]|nr:hypothetical protein [Verrucomicrobiota bacterium]